MAEPGSAKKARTESRELEDDSAIDVDDRNEDGRILDEIPSLEDDEALETELRLRQAEIDDCQAELLEKLREIEASYELKKRPLYKARGEVISRIPGFWLHCFMQHERVRYILGTVDQDILSSLLELEVENLEENNSGYKIRLIFGPNSTFEDEVLEKEIRFDFEEGQPVVCCVTGCSPRWKGEDPTAPETPLKGKKRSRESSTFFRWFTQEKAFEPGLVDTLADIIKDQIYLNPLAFLDAAQNEAANAENHKEDGAEDVDDEPIDLEANGAYSDSGTDRSGSVWGTEEAAQRLEDEARNLGDSALQEQGDDQEEELPDYEEGTEDDRLDADVDFDNAEDPTNSLQEPNEGAELLHEADVKEVPVEEGSLQPPDVNYSEPAALQQTPEEQSKPLGAGFASQQEQDPSQPENAGGETVQPKEDLDESDQGIGEGDDAELDDLDDIGPGEPLDSEE